jgi:putative ABC transport system permease protein
MIGRETLRIAVDGLLANRLRSSLTILGLAIGVASVIVLIAVGNGSSLTVQKRIESLGTNVLLVTRGFQRGGAGATAATAPLTEKAAEALENPDNAPDVQSVSPVVNAASATLVAGGTSYSPSTFVGTTPSYLTAHTYQIADGASFTSQDVKDHSAVVVIGPTVVENLFPASSPIGQSIQIDGANFQVIGVTKSKGASGAVNQDDIAIAPISTVQDQLTGYGPLSSITVQAKSQEKLNAAEAEVSSILQGQLGTTAANPGFNIINQGSILEASSSTSSVFTTLLGEVAAISLLVGGIGVMNIMLVSVTERTREIGIRKAIGARHSDILGQFLTEAVMVSILGGAIGVLVGVVGSQFEIAGVQPVIAGYSIFLAFGAAVATGLFFGTYPASRAAGLRPIEALRYE